jgi:hypothetical protein
LLRFGPGELCLPARERLNAIPRGFAQQDRGNRLEEFCREETPMRGMLLLPLILLPIFLYAQQGKEASLAATPPAFTANVVEQNEPVSHSDLYCAGFLSPVLLPRNHFVAGGLDTPIQSRYTTDEFIFLRGNGYQPGTRVSIVRALHNPDRFDPFPGEGRALKRAGHLYADLGYAVVVENRGTNTAVAKIEFACDSILPGDQVVAFEPKPPVSYRKSSAMDRFPEKTPSVNGKIVAARDFEQFPASGRKIYLNIGTNRGVKAGDYFRIVRGYSVEELDPSDAEILNATAAEDTQRNPRRLRKSELKELPRRVVGEALILSTQPQTATAMITFALADIQVGDRVELEEGQGR